MTLGSSWFNSVSHATLLLAGATVLLAVISAFGAEAGRRAVKAAKRTAEAAEKQVDATAESVKAAREAVAVARDSLTREHRPVLTDVPLRKYSVYGLAKDALKVLPGGGSSTLCTVPLQNVGTGTAVVEHEAPSPAIQVRLNSLWFKSTVDVRVLPVGEVVMLDGSASVVPTDDPNTHQAPTIYVRVAYSDLSGNRYVTYLCLMRDQESEESWEHADLWSVHGVAFDDGLGFVQTGDGWNGFIQDAPG